jgi:hypothetical protein
MISTRISPVSFSAAGLPFGPVFSAVYPTSSSTFFIGTSSPLAAGFYP